MKTQVFDMTRVWAMVTGLFLTGWYFGEVYSGTAPSQTLPLLVTGIGGFEMFLFGQDRWLKRKGNNG